jgi:hypothetical protein
MRRLWRNNIKLTVDYQKEGILFGYPPFDVTYKGEHKFGGRAQGIAPTMDEAECQCIMVECDAV